MQRRLGWFLAAAAIPLGALTLSPRSAEAYSLRGFHGAIVVRGLLGGPFSPSPYANPYCGFKPYWWAPCYRPASLRPSNGFEMRLAGSGGVGDVDLDVAPSAAEVWVDGRFVAEAGDLDGSPAPLWLQDGSHRLVIYEDGYRSFDQSISVEPGRKLKLQVRLEKGDSRPQGR